MLKNPKSFLTDVLINLAGFVFLGIITTMFFSNILNFNVKLSFLFSLSYCCLLSLFIEFCQMWLPARSSDIVDLICNTSGALVGIFLVLGFPRLFQRMS